MAPTLPPSLPADTEEKTNKTTREQFVEVFAVGFIILFLLVGLAMLATFFWLDSSDRWRDLEQAGILIGAAGAFWAVLVGQGRTKKKSIRAGVLIALGGAMVILSWFMSR